MRLLILASWIFLSGQVAQANYSGPNYTDVLTNTQMKFRSDSAYPLYLTGTIKKIYKGPFDTCAIDSEYLKCWEKKISIENRELYSQVETISKLASENNLELVKCSFLQTLASRNAEADFFWSEMLNQNFDVSTKLLQNIKYFAKLCIK